MSSQPERVLRSQAESEVPATPQQLFYRIKQDIIATKGSGYLNYTSISPTVGHQVARSLGVDPQVESASPRLSYNPTIRVLSVTMPTIFHNSHQSWASVELFNASATGFFTINEVRHLDFASDSRFDNFPPPWQNIYKEPDYYIQPAGATLPTIVFEVGYSESYPRLVADKDLWLTGGAPVVNVVVLIKWTRVAGNCVKGFIEVWRRGAPNPQRIDIFPAPAPGAPAGAITLYRYDIYGRGGVPPGRNLNDAWTWDLENLRESARRTIGYEGLTPA